MLELLDYGYITAENCFITTMDVLLDFGLNPDELNVLKLSKTTVLVPSLKELEKALSKRKGIMKEAYEHELERYISFQIRRQSQHR